jgi:Ca-activated chloride channel homolog
MQQPTITIVPLKSAVANDRTTHLDLLVKISLPPVKTQFQRPPLNIGLVIDRSGSMQGKKIEYARQAAIYAIEQLLPTDRASVTIYDDKVDVIVPNTLVQNKTDICQKIRHITERGMTNLHEGWLQGGIQVSQNLSPQQIDRVLLLSDGLANVGETNPDAIASDVRGLAKRGVNTSTLGVGDDYNEDLMEAIARSGDGNYYYIDNPDRLPEFFALELQGLIAMYGQKVSIGFQPDNGVVVTDIFNDLERTNYGNYKLANLIHGSTSVCALRLKIPAMSTETKLCSFRLAWDEPGKTDRQSLTVEWQLPVVNSEEFDRISPDPDVQQIVAQLMAARAKTEAIYHLDRGNVASARKALRVARARVSADLPAFMQNSPIIKQELSDLDLAEEQLTSGETSKLRKNISSQNYQRRQHTGDLYED